AERVLRAIEQHAQTALLSALEALAKKSGTIVNAVMLGLTAGCGRLPIPVEAFEAAIRGEAKAAESNLRGFRAGLDAARAGARPPQAKPEQKRGRPGAPTPAD